jgi:NADPH-dependent 2,4-dienoyl-CoA reductase/sulfur reductase-like enzyme
MNQFNVLFETLQGEQNIMTKLLIIGGSDAGISAALRSKEIDQSIETNVVVADSFPNFSICGLPFYLSGEVSDWRTLAHRTEDEIERWGIRLFTGHRAMRINPETKSVECEDINGAGRLLKYDKLIIASGAVPARPSLEGLDLPGAFTLRWMEDGFSIRRYIKEKCPKSALILGSGYIGMEMADALTRKGLSVTVLGHSGRVLKTVDPEIGNVIREELSRNNVRLIDRFVAEAVEKKGGRLFLRNKDGIPVEGDMLIVATGGQPETKLASDAGITTGLHSAIKVNHAMETNMKDIYAAGDCVETWHRLLKKYTYLPLGTTAHKQGRVAGENAGGGKAQFSGSLGTQVVKVFDLVAARTGLEQEEAGEAGFDPVTAELKTWDHKLYYPGVTTLWIRVTGDRKTHCLLGAQILGSYSAEVSKRIDIFATAIFHRMEVESILDLDLSYTPPLSSPWDPVQMASHAWMEQNRKMG